MITHILQKDLYNDFVSIVSNSLDRHPFSKITSKNQILSLLPHYLAMSLAFPYLQAGSQASIIIETINSNVDIAEHIELTSVVGNFLCWDETGGAFVLEKFGKVGLPKILQTRKWLHANLLRDDIQKLSGNTVTPNFSEPTRSYLLSLMEGLSDKDPVVRTAYMVAFEVHANTMINALWKSICNNFDHRPEDLIYFMCHVGGDDALESYHVAMVEELVRKVVPGTEEQKFLSVATKAMQENINWCAAIVEM